MNENVVRSIELCYKADLPCFLWGTQGIGKSQIVEQVAKNAGAKFICKHFAQLELGDLVGMVHTKEADGDVVTDWARPKFFPTEEGPGIFFCDEFNRVNEIEMRALFEFVLNRKINEYSLPKGWYVMAAGNPGTDEFFTRSMDLAMLSRFVNVKAEPDLVSWIKWSSKNSVEQTVIDFVNENPDYFAPDSSMASAFMSDAKIRPCPRTWDMISKLMKVCKESDLKEGGPIEHVLPGMIGTETTVHFMRHIKDLLKLKPPTGDEVIYRFDESAKGKIKKMIGKKSIRADLLTAMVTNVRTYIETENINPKDCEGVFKMLNMLPEDLMCGTMKEWFEIPKLREVISDWGNHECSRETFMKYLNTFKEDEEESS